MAGRSDFLSTYQPYKGNEPARVLSDKLTQYVLLQESLIEQEYLLNALERKRKVTEWALVALKQNIDLMQRGIYE